MSECSSSMRTHKSMQKLNRICQNPVFSNADRTQSIRPCCSLRSELSSRKSSVWGDSWRFTPSQTRIKAGGPAHPSFPNPSHAKLLWGKASLTGAHRRKKCAQCLVRKCASALRGWRAKSARNSGRGAGLGRGHAGEVSCARLVRRISHGSGAAGAALV